MFQTIVHPTDFDEPSKEAFRVARSLAAALGARIVALHVVAPPAMVADDGRHVIDPKHPNAVDVWAEYRALQAETPKVPVQYAILVGDPSESTRLIGEKIRELGEGALVVMGSHARRGLGRFLWGSKAEEAVRDCPCPVMVVKAPAPREHARDPAAEAAASA